MYMYHPMHDVEFAHLFELNEPGFGELDRRTLSDSLDDAVSVDGC